MRKMITTVFLLAIIYCLFNYSEHIMQFIMVNFIYKKDFEEKTPNEYYNKDNFKYVQLTNTMYPKNKQDILNIFYTALDKGYDELTFYCPMDYTDCIEDVNTVAMQETTLSYVNNFVKTYNTYNKIYVNINNFGRINITINKIYDNESIKKLNDKINEIYPTIINDSMSLEEKIKAAHDYIINSTSYDKERANQIKNNIAVDEAHPSNTALGPLYTGKAICGGYTDAMALFLDKIGVKNIKIASKNHIWNAIYINNEWKHIDLTWDDPVVINGGDTITYDYFLITTDEILSKNDEQHNFNKDIFKELKTSN